MASSKKKQDEKHLKILREMVALAHNKQCFDCHQRGPTYINMTIGSFVCTACSGLLRGLNPPHRVKSISMASFTPEEMEFIKCHGNEFCRKVWLGLYDNRLGNQSESREESKVKDFMSEKYERKRYYVAPTDTMKEEAMRMNESAILSKAPGTRPLKALLGENAPKLHVGNHQEIQRGSATRASLTIQGDLFAPASGVVQQTGGDMFATTFAEVQQQESNLFESTQDGQQSGNALFGAGNGLEQSTGNDLFASTNGTGQSSGGGLFASETSSSSIENSMGMLKEGFPSLGGGEQPTGATMFGQSSSLGQNSGESLFAGQQQPANDLFGGQPGTNPASTTGIAQSAGSSMFASMGNTSQLMGNSLFAASNVEAQPGGTANLFASSAVGQPVGSASFAQTSGMSGDGLFVSSAYAPSSSGGNLFSQSSDVTQSSAMFPQNVDIPQPNPFGSSNVNQNQQLSSQTMFDAGGQGTSAALPTATTNLFGGQTSQSSDLFSGQMNQGQTDAFGGQGSLAGGNPFGAGQANTPVQTTSIQGGPAIPSGNQGLADMFGSQSTQVLTNSVVQEPKPVSATPPPIGSTPQSPGNQSVQSSKSSGSTAMDLLGDLGGDPFASSGPQTQSSTGGFADFGNFGNTGSQSGGFPPVKPQSNQPPAFAQSTPLQPFGSASSTTTTPSQALNGGVAPPAAGGDKYSNLSDLFSMATTTEADSTASTGWNMTSTASAPVAGGGGGGLNWNSGGGGSSASTGGINWGGDSSAIPSAGGGINWNSSSSAPSVSSTGGGWGGGSVSMGNVNSAATTGMGWGAPATAQSNVANPFGGGTGTSLSTQAPTSMAGASNPFGGSQAGTQQQFGGGGYGNQPGGFGQFGAQQNVAVSSAAPGQFGQFGGMQNGGFGAMTSTGGFGGVQTNTQAGFGQPQQQQQQQFMAPPAYGQQQQAVGGGFGAMPHSGYGAQSAQQGFGQPAPGYGAQPQQQMQGFPGSGGWGQAPVASSANPFMSTAQQYSVPPKSGTTNPFL